MKRTTEPGRGGVSVLYFNSIDMRIYGGRKKNVYIINAKKMFTLFM